MKYSVPKAVKHHVDFVLPSVHFDVPHENAAVIRYESGHFKRNAHYKRNDSDSVPQPGHHNSPIDPKVGKKVTPLAGPSAQGSLDTCNQQARRNTHTHLSSVDSRRNNLVFIHVRLRLLA